MASQIERPYKRRRLDNEPQHPDGDIRGAFELHNLLRFRQSAEPEVKAGIDRFRTFLIDIASSKEPSKKKVLMNVLKHYCDDQSSSTKNEVDFPDLLSTWSFAAQKNADSITSGVPAVLAQFFRTINNELEFRDFGLSLCHSLLKSDQVRLLDRGLSAPKHKDFVISPCLRLLTEITSFDAGALAANVFSRRDILLKRLENLLEPPPRHREELDRRQPTIRRNAQRLLLALIRYLDGEAKAELVTQGKALYSCIRSLSIDGGDIVRDVLKTIRLSLLSPGVSKEDKIRFLNVANLQSFAQLYDFEAEDVDEQSDAAPVRQVAHDFIIYACTSSNGAPTPQNGWYPASFESNRLSGDDDSSCIDLGLDSPYYSDEYTTSVPVKNTTLSIFLQKLKPASDILQAELVLKIFSAAPELVADYFYKRPKSLGSPSNNNSWLGEFGFLYSVVDLPVPSNMGYGGRIPNSPPPLSIVVENVLPRALDRSSSTSFLKKNEDITIMSASRLLTVSLQKLDTVIKLFKSQRKHRQLWSQASIKLIGLVSTRAPLYHEFVTLLQKTPKENVTVRGAILECMAMYKKVLPNATVSSSSDVGPILLEVLRQLNEDELEDESSQALDKQKVALVTIAGLSRGTKWWHKSASEHLCPIVALLVDVATRSHLSEGDAVMINVLRGIFEEKGILHSAQKAWSALTESLRSSLSAGQPYDQTLLNSLENCMTRTMKQPVKYVDYLEDIRVQTPGSKPLSLLACAIAEQCSHLLKEDDLKATSDFISKFFALLAAGGEDDTVLDVLRFRMLEAAEHYKKHHKVFKKAFESQVRRPITFNLDAAAPPARQLTRHRHPSSEPLAQLSSSRHLLHYQTHIVLSHRRTPSNPTSPPALSLPASPPKSAFSPPPPLNSTSAPYPPSPSSSPRSSRPPTLKQPNSTSSSAKSSRLRASTPSTPRPPTPTNPETRRPYPQSSPPSPSTSSPSSPIPPTPCTAKPIASSSSPPPGSPWPASSPTGPPTSYSPSLKPTLPSPPHAPTSKPSATSPSSPTVSSQYKTPSSAVARASGSD